MSESSAQALATLLRVQRYYDTCHELSGELVTAAALPEESLQTATRALLQQGEQVLLRLDPARGEFAPLDTGQANAFEADYQILKAGLLAAGAAGDLDIARMDALLRSFSALRRIIAQADKAAHLLEELETDRPPAAA